MEDMAVLIPINSPSVLTNAPPLFPMFTAASVWIKDWFLLSLSLRSLDLALMIPAVTVELRLKGFPTANTHSPIRATSESPKGIKGNDSLVFIFRTAKSVLGSDPITSAV